MSKHNKPAPAFADPAIATKPVAIDLIPAPESIGALVPRAESPPETETQKMPVSPTDLPATIDAHGHDLADYKWIPVLRRRREDGWSPEKQRKFIEALADTGSVEAAAREVGMTVNSCYRLRRAPGAESFAAAWDAAIAQASKRLVDIAFDRAINGVEDIVFNKDGQRIGCRMRYNDRLLMFLLRAHHPAHYRHAHQSVRGPGEPAPPVPARVAEMIENLVPAVPPDPHLLVPPEDLPTALLVADLGDGELPIYHRDPPVYEPYVESPLGEEFERLLQAAKDEAAASERPRGYVGDEDEDEDEEPF